MAAAGRAVRLASAEFKAATAGMDDWGASADGLQAKLSSLDKILEAQKKQQEQLSPTAGIAATCGGAMRGVFCTLSAAKKPPIFRHRIPVAKTGENWYNTDNHLKFRRNL